MNGARFSCSYTYRSSFVYWLMDFGQREFNSRQSSRSCRHLWPIASVNRPLLLGKMQAIGEIKTLNLKTTLRSEERPPHSHPFVTLVHAEIPLVDHLRTPRTQLKGRPSAKIGNTNEFKVCSFVSAAGKRLRQSADFRFETSVNKHAEQSEARNKRRKFS